MQADENDLAALRAQKLREKIQQIQEAQEREEQKKHALKYLCSPEAFQRLMNVKLANPSLYEQVSSVLIYLAQSKQLGGKVSEEQLKKLLAKLSEKKEGKIEIRRKSMEED